MNKSFSQACTTLGQTPATAFPVCGTSTFTQTSVPACTNARVPTQCQDGSVYADINPYWYKFTCYATGTLGFLVTPKNLADDYDWELFDITNHDPSEIYTNASLIVSSNWSGSPGITGASPAARNPFECASVPANGVSTFSIMPTIVAGHNYLLLISHFDGATQSGYTLTFPTGAQGGTASIVDPVVPAIQQAYAVCDGTQIVMKINKKIACATIASNGSDFSVSGPASINVTAASGNGCTNGFDADTIVLKLNNTLSPGTYTVTAKIGTDGNTITDNCNNSLAVGSNATLTFTPAAPTPLDSIQPVICITDTLHLVFSNPMRCNSIAPDGSDFIITGPVPVSIKSASGICNQGVSSFINILLSAPIRYNGTFQLTLVSGNDGNPLINECGIPTPAGSSLLFTTKNITTADFQSAVTANCKYDILRLSHDGNNSANQWNWTIDDGRNSTLQNPSFQYTAFGNKAVTLVVTNGKCTDSITNRITLPDYSIKAAFTSKDTLCPADVAHFTDASITASNVSIIGWKWNFDNGATSSLQVPADQTYAARNRATLYIASLIVQNNKGCSDTAYHQIIVLNNCYIAVPSAFTPNGDGLNDYLYPLNAYKADNLLFRVYNRYGQLVFETKDRTRKWDGRVAGVPQPAGTYVWMLSYVEHDSGQKVETKGTVVLIR